MSHLLIFGLGYTTTRLAAAIRARGWTVSATRREAAPGALAFTDEAAVRPAIAAATHIVSSVPPAGETDPVLDRYADALIDCPARWIGYLSSTGVYGDPGGAWVDESAPTGTGRRSARAAADHAWLSMWPQSRVFRLPGIYGPGRSPLDRVREGRAHRIDLPDQIFSRIHVDDIVSGVIAAFDAAPGAYNLADDLPASQNDVIDHACALLGLAPPPLLTLEQANLSPMARGFYAENRRVANGRAKRLLKWRPRYPDYRAGLRALNASTSPMSVSAAPAPAVADQR